MMEDNLSKQQLLRNPDIEPTSEVIAEGLLEVNSTYVEFLSEIGNHDIDVQWRYYNDGKAWLAKGQHKWVGVRGGKKETAAFWLSIWDGFFKISIFIPEKARTDALALPLGDVAQQMVAESKQMGKMKFFPVIFDVYSREILNDIYTLCNFRKKLK
jgi:hypothetical protein